MFGYGKTGVYAIDWSLQEKQNTSIQNRKQIHK